MGLYNTNMIFFWAQVVEGEDTEVLVQSWISEAYADRLHVRVTCLNIPFLLSTGKSLNFQFMKVFTFYCKVLMVFTGNFCSS